MSTTTNVPQVKLNIMTQQQYNTATKNPTELYMVTDAQVSYNDLADLPDPIQVSTVPTAASTNVGQIIQYIGTTTSTYTKGYFYTCTASGSPATYSWTRIDVQPAGGGSSLPSQTGQSGKFLTTDGTDASWANIPNEIPTQSGNSGKFLTTDGSAVSWATLNIPIVDQTYSSSSTNAQSGVAVASAIDAAISCVYKAAGTVAFANKPALSSSIEGNVYNISDSFTTTSDFVEGSGNTYPAGTNIVCINTASSGQTPVYKWDVLAGFVDLSGYQPLLVSGTNLKTINSTSLLGSGDIAITGLPSQTSQSGKFLTTDGSSASWANIPTEIPSQSGNSGKFLTTNGTSVSWAPALINNLSSSSIVNTIYVSDNYRAYHSYSTAVGNSADTGNTYATSIGYNTNSGNYSVAIGANAKANVTGAVQIGKGTNSTAGTMYVALGTTSSSITNYQLLASDGTIPEARLASTTSATQNQVLKLDSNLNAVWADDNGATVTIRDWTV